MKQKINISQNVAIVFIIRFSSKGGCVKYIFQAYAVFNRLSILTVYKKYINLRTSSKFLKKVILIFKIRVGLEKVFDNSFHRFIPPTIR